MARVTCELCRGGSDWQKIMIKEINPDGTSTLLNDTLSNVKFSNTAWAPDNKVTHCPESLSGHHTTAEARPCGHSGFTLASKSRRTSSAIDMGDLPVLA